MSSILKITDAIPPDLITGYAGNTGVNSPNPFVSGYWMAMFHLPSYVPDFIAREKWLTATCKNYSPHTRSITTGAFPGIGGLSKQIAISQEIGNTFSLDFSEYSNFEIINTFEHWTKFMDPQMGISGHSLKSDYKGIVILFLMNGQHPLQQKNINPLDLTTGVRKIVIYRNAWPTQDGVDVLSSNIESNDLVSPSIQFTFDGYPQIFSEEDAIVLYTSRVLQVNIELMYDTSQFHKMYQKITGKTPPSTLTESSFTSAVLGAVTTGGGGNRDLFPIVAGHGGDSLFTDILDFITDGITFVEESVTGVINDTIQLVGNTITSASDLIDGGISNALTSIETATGIYPNKFLNDGVNFIMSGAKTSFESAKGLLDFVPDSIATGLAVLTDPLAAANIDLTTVTNSAQGILGNLGGNDVNLINAALNTVGLGSVTDIQAAASGGLGSAVAILTQNATELGAISTNISGVISSIENIKLDSAISAIQGVASGVISDVNTAINSSAGPFEVTVLGYNTELIDGTNNNEDVGFFASIASGLSSAANSLLPGVSGAIDSILNPASGTLSISVADIISVATTVQGAISTGDYNNLINKAGNVAGVDLSAVTNPPVGSAIGLIVDVVNGGGKDIAGNLLNTLKGNLINTALTSTNTRILTDLGTRMGVPKGELDAAIAQINNIIVNGGSELSIKNRLAGLSSALRNSNNAMLADIVDASTSIINKDGNELSTGIKALSGITGITGFEIVDIPQSIENILTTTKTTVDGILDTAANTPTVSDIVDAATTQSTTAIDNGINAIADILL